MAKQLVNPIERHVEKVVLGLAGVLLLGVAAKYLVTKPNYIELGAERVYPDTIDRHLAVKAEVVRQALRAHQPKTEEFNPILDEFVKNLRPLEKVTQGSLLRPAVPIGPEVPIIDPFSSTVEKARLVEVVKLPKPQVTSGRMMITTEPDPTKKGPEVAVDWVTVSALFDRKAQSELQQRAYGMRYGEVIFGAPQLQRRERRPDGTWSDDDWADVDAWPAARLARIPSVPLVTEGKQTFVPKDAAQAIDKFVEALKRPGEQLEAIRPLPPVEVTSPRSWTFPVLTSLHDVALQDDDYLYSTATEPAAAAPRLVRYPWLLDSPAEKPKEADKILTPAEEIRKAFQQADKLLESATKNKSLDEANEADNLYIDIMENPQATPGDKSRAERGHQKAEQLIKDIKFGSEQPPGPGDPSKGAKTRELVPMQQMWAHDAKPGSLVNGRTYQYRMRPVILNRLIGFPEKFETPADATKPMTVGSWSEPTDAVTLEPASQFFVTRFDERKREVTAEMFQWYKGIWVETKHKLKVGDRVLVEDRVDTPDPQDPESVYRAKVAFDPGATIVDIDFDRRVRERKAERGGIKFLAPGDKTCAVVVLGPEGQLDERIELLDRSDPTKTALKSKVWKAPKAKE